MEKINAKFKSPFYASTFFSFVAGLFIHFFGLVNVLHNHDNIYRVAKGYGSGVRSGRWFLTVLGDLVDSIFGGHNLHWLNGVIFIAILSVCAGMLVSIFKVRSRLSAIVLGICAVSFPPVASTLFYRFTSIYYGISIFLAIFAGYMIANHKVKVAFPIAVICIALSMGIYQAYVSFTISILVILLLKMALDNETTPKKIVVSGICYVSVLALGASLYFLLMKLSLVAYDMVLSDYKGINDMGISLSELPSLISSAFLPILKLPLKDYEDIAQTVFVRSCYLAIWIICAIRICILFFKKTKKAINIICSIIFCLILPVAINFVVIMCGRQMVYTLMLYPLVMILFIPVLLDEWLPKLEGKLELLNCCLKKITVAVLILLSCFYTYQTNTNYTIQYYSNEQVVNYYNRMVTRVQMTPGYDTSKKWVFIGKNNDPLLTKSWNISDHFRGNMELERLIDFRREYWIKEYLGITLPIAKDEEKARIGNTETVKDMTCWPNDGSVQIIDDYVIIKLSDEIAQ